MGLRGDFGKLKKLSKRFAKVRGQQFARGLSLAIAEEARDLVLRCLDTSTDPYGHRYTPLKYRRGKPLEKTGRLRNSISYIYSAGGFRLFSAVFYALYQNRGSFSVRGRTGWYGAKAAEIGARTRRSKAGLHKMKGTVVRVHLPQRMFIPVGRALPKPWLKAIVTVGNAFLKRYMK